MTTFGHFLTSELEAKHIDQIDLANMAGTTAATISRVISGKRGPSDSLCYRISNALDLPVELVLEKAGKIKRTGEYSTLVTMIAHKVSLLAEKEQRIMLKVIEALLDEQGTI